MPASLSVHAFCKLIADQCAYLMGHGDWILWYQSMFSWKYPPQTPFAAMSSRAPACELAVAPISSSSVTGWSSGSVHTSLHTSMRRVAVRSRMSLCLIDGKPPLAQDRACSTEKGAPQAHFDGSLSDSIWCPTISVGPGHYGRLLCVGWNRILWVARLWARKRSPSP